MSCSGRLINFFRQYQHVKSNPLSIEGSQHPLLLANRSHIEARSGRSRFEFPSRKKLVAASSTSFIFAIPLSLILILTNALQNSSSIIYFIIGIWIFITSYYLFSKSAVTPNSAYGSISTIYKGLGVVDSIRAVDLWMTGITAREIAAIILAEKAGYLDRKRIQIPIDITFLLILTFLYAGQIHLVFVQESESGKTWVYFGMLAFSALPIYFLTYISTTLLDSITFRFSLYYFQSLEESHDKRKKMSLKNKFLDFKRKPFLFFVLFSVQIVTATNLVFLDADSGHFRIVSVLCVFYLLIALVGAKLLVNAVMNYDKNLDTHFQEIQKIYDDFHLNLAEKLGLS